MMLPLFDDLPPVTVPDRLPPIAPATGLSRHCSAMGALQAKNRAALQTWRLVSAYQRHDTLTDAEMATLTGIQRSSVIPRRRELMKRGLVETRSTRKNLTSGVNNTTYGLVRSK